MGSLSLSEEGLEKWILPEELISLIENIFWKIEKKQWSNERIQNFLWRRTISEIIASWETCYMWSCVDMTLVFLSELKKKHPHPEHIELGCELLERENNGFRNIHFFIKDLSVSPARVIDFVWNNKVRIYDWTYTNPRFNRGIKQLWLLSLSAQEISENDSLFTLAPKLGLPFWETDFQAYFEKLKSDNTDHEFDGFSSKRAQLSITVNGVPVALSWWTVGSKKNSEIFRILRGGN